MIDVYSIPDKPTVFVSLTHMAIFRKSIACRMLRRCPQMELWCFDSL